jgi:ketosteroid isomerase-like protein
MWATTPGDSPALRLVREAVDAINRGDWATALRQATPDFEYDLRRTDSPLQGVHPLAEMPRVMEEFLGTWESVRYEPGDVLESGEHVVMDFTTHFRGRDGIELQSRATWVWTIRDGGLARLVLHQDRAEALRDIAA